MGLCQVARPRTHFYLWPRNNDTLNCLYGELGFDNKFLLNILYIYIHSAERNQWSQELLNHNGSIESCRERQNYRPYGMYE